VCGQFTDREGRNLFNKVEGKFSTPAEGEFNLICVTGYAPADDDMEAAAYRFLEHHLEITGIIYWSYHASTGRSWTYLSKASKLPELILKIDPEESFYASRITHPVINPKTGRPMENPEDLIDYLSTLG